MIYQEEYKILIKTYNYVKGINIIFITTSWSVYLRSTSQY